MTQVNHVAQCSCSPQYAGAAVRRRSPVECQVYDNFVATVNGNLLRSVACGSASQMCQTSARRYARQRAVRSRVLRGGVRSWANHSRGVRRGLGEREEIDFFETCGRRIFRHSGASASLSGASTSPASHSRKRPAARHGRLISTSTAQPHLPMKRSWSCSTNCDRASGLEDYCPRCGVIESSCICNYILSRERMQRKHRATRPVDRCGFRSTLVAAVGVCRRNVEQGGRTTADQELAAQSFSSGDGLGIQQPGSNTWGGFFVPTAPSGRADESAMCPAVARSYSSGREGRRG